MFQNYDSPPSENRAPERVARLRELMAAAGVDFYLVPRADRHQGEYVPACAERLSWLTGFSGSAGVAVIGFSSAAVFVDGRYTVQVAREIDTDVFELPEFGPAAPAKWINEIVGKGGAVVGFDPWLHTSREIDRLKAVLEPRGVTIKPLSRRNLVDVVWGKDRPGEPLNKVIVQPLKYAGQTSADKVKEIQLGLRALKVDAALLTLPDSICWLLNIRGTDVAHNPVALCFAIVPARGKVELFIAREKLDAQVRAHLKKSVRVASPLKLAGRLRELKRESLRVQIDPTSAAIWFERRLKKAQVVHGADPCVLPKAIKNNTEIEGSRAAHVRDGRAVVRFLAWLAGRVHDGGVDEVLAAQKLEEFRAGTGELCEISFDTISGSGPNGAIVHYRVTNSTNRKLKSGELFLVDSGGQYRDGTTDITRTVAIGRPNRDMRTRFTQVLKGHIGIARARFPVGTRGVDIDGFARRALWSAGVDYDHGTGHGVGSYLSVHEGPVSISKAGMVPFRPGMILSNEPGYYREGHFGIRIENLVLVEAARVPKGGTREMLSFETLTLAPIDRSLVEPNLLSPQERAWLDGYHMRVRKELSPGLDGATRAWLRAATDAI